MIDARIDDPLCLSSKHLGPPAERPPSEIGIISKNGSVAIMAWVITNPFPQHIYHMG